MNSPTKSIDSIRDELRSHQPVFTELSRLRIEQDLVERHHDRRRYRARIPVLAACVLAAAASLLVYVTWGKNNEATLERARFSQAGRYESSPASSREIRFGESVIVLRGSTRADWSGVLGSAARLELEIGEVNVAYHPIDRAREGLTVRTAEARIDVVGTEFRVTRDANGTRVEVREGIVRVSNLSDSSDVVLLRRGESKHIERHEPDFASRGTENIQPENVRPDVGSSPSSLSTSSETGESAGNGAAHGSEHETLRLDPETLCARGDILRARGDFRAALQAYSRAATVARRARDMLGLQNAIYSKALLLERDLHDSAAAVHAYREYLATGGSASELAKRNLCRLGELEFCADSAR